MMYTMITAHSGCDGTPDNSLEFVIHALSCGADALEVDVRARQDGTLYLSHDSPSDPLLTLEDILNKLRRRSVQISCSLRDPSLEQPVRELAQRLEMGDRVCFQVVEGAVELEIYARKDGTLCLSQSDPDAICPTLEEVFALVRDSSMKINCDLKEADLELPVRDLAIRMGIWDRVLYSGEVSTDLMAVNEEVSARTLLNLNQLLGKSDAPNNDDRLDELVAACRRVGARTVNFHHKYFTDVALERLSREGIAVSAWTVNEPVLARRLLKWGVFNITTRHPGMLLELRQEL